MGLMGKVSRVVVQLLRAPSSPFPAIYHPQVQATPPERPSSIKVLYTGEDSVRLTDYDFAVPLPAQLCVNGPPAGLSVASPWFIRRKAAANGFHQQVVCFHSMGTGASLFTPFLMDPPDGLDAIAVQLPGRETRADEAVLTNMSDIVSGILGEMETSVGTPDIFWGHSFRGIIAFEVLKAFRRQGKPLPRLLVTSTIAPHLIRLWQKRDVLLRIMAEDYSPDYLLAVSRYVDNADFVRSILPLMRRDTPLLLGYQIEEEEILDVPITAFAARQDDMVYPDEVAAWKSYTKEFNLVEVDGDHWFLHRNRKLLLETLAAMAR